jgi:hypothetical protein
MGALLTDIVPAMGLGEQALITPEYFANLGECLASLMISELLTPSSLATLTNRMIYKDMANFDTPKVVREAVVDYKLVWKRLQSGSVNPDGKDVLFLLIHNKLPVPERLFRIGVKNDPYCLHCPGAEVADVEHFFCACKRTCEGWSWVRLKILGLCNQGLLSSNWELLNLFLPRTQFEEEIVWLISIYVNYVWNIVFIGDSEFKLEKFFGFLKFKYKNSGVSLGWISGLG